MKCSIDLHIYRYMTQEKKVWTVNLEFEHNRNVWSTFKGTGYGKTAMCIQENYQAMV